MSFCFLKQHQKQVCKTLFCKIKQRKYEIILNRLRSGNIGLNANLKKIGLHETGYCSMCIVPETVDHFLIECPRYIIPRSMLLVEVNSTNPIEILSLLASEEYHVQKALVDFIIRSQRL